MLEELYTESVNHLETEFYKKNFRFSYSSICNLIYSPAIFYQMYVLGFKQERTAEHLIKGSVIHCLLLEKELFDKYYIVSPTTLPTGTSRILIDTVYYKNKNLTEKNSKLKLEDLSSTILSTMIEINYFQTLKIDQARLDKVLTEENKNYFEFLKKKNGKEIVDKDTLKYCQDAVDIISLNKRVSYLLGQNLELGEDNVEIYNEEYIEGDIKGYPFGFKGIIDNLHINHDNKIIYINDFKTSGKSLKDFKDSIEYYSYWLQAIMYMIMVSQKYFHLLEAGYTIKFHFVVIDKYFNVYPFAISEKTRQEWFERFNNEVLPIAKYHYENRRYNLPYEYDTNSVIL